MNVLRVEMQAIKLIKKSFIDFTIFSRAFKKKYKKCVASTMNVCQLCEHFDKNSFFLLVFIVT